MDATSVPGPSSRRMLRVACGALALLSLALVAAPPAQAECEIPSGCAPEDPVAMAQMVVPWAQSDGVSWAQNDAAAWADGIVMERAGKFLDHTIVIPIPMPGGLHYYILAQNLAFHLCIGDDDHVMIDVWTDSGVVIWTGESAGTQGEHGGFSVLTDCPTDGRL